MSSAEGLAPPTKTKKRSRKEIARPEVVLEIAEPADQHEETEKPRFGRQCNVDEVPYEFLDNQTKAQIDAMLAEETLKEKLKEVEDAKNAKKAKTILGLFIGAGLGMFLAYTARRHLKGLFETVEHVSDSIQ